MTSLPADWEKLVAFLELEVGLVFDQTPDNLGMIAVHMRCSTSQALAMLKLLKRRGVLTTNKRYMGRRRWIVVAKVA